MATTTNYGWTTPDDTALVKDGAAAIRTLGSSVDTTTKNLNPSTTLGDIEYRSSTANVNTRLPLGTAGQVLKVNSGATAPEWATDATGMTNPMTTTGDTIYSSSGSTPARLGIGTTGQVLTVDGGVPSWAAPASGGGMTLLGTTTLSSTSTTISITPTGYVSLLFLVYGVTVSGNGADIIFKPNNEASLTNWNKLHQYATACDVEFAQNSRYGTGSPAQTGGANAYMYQIYNVDTAAFKPIEFSAVYLDDSSRQASENGGGGFRSTSTITSMVIATANGATFNAGTVLTYGVK
jgi:hypothetical protein